MRALTVFLALFLMIACKKGGTKPMETTLIKPDSVSKPLDTTKKPLDTVKQPPVVKPIDTNKGRQINYLALGDSYTIGESVERSLIFPYQLLDRVKVLGRTINPPTIIAQTGWTTSELQYAIKNSGVINKFDMVTLLIGVNNQYRGQSREVYRKEFKELLETAISYAKGDKNHVFVISIPDWSATPYGKQYGNQQAVAADIDAFNAINKAETLALGISYTDITPASRLAATDGELVASDGLHPSAKMYQSWAFQLAPLVINSFK